MINISTRANLVNVPVENYLKFDLVYLNQTGAASSARWDTCGAHGVIQRIRIWHGSNLLQDIDNYGVLAKMIFETQVPTDSTYGKYNILAGTKNDLKLLTTVNTPNAIGTVDNTTGATTGTYISNYLDNSKVVQVNSGDAIATNIATTTTSTSKTYCLNLISLMGSLCSQNYFPLFACTSAPLRMEIQLVSSVEKCLAVTLLTGATTQTVQLRNVEFVASMIELNDASMSMVQSSLNGPLQFVIPDYRNYQWSGAVTASGQLNMPIPAKFSSVKAFYISLRDKGAIVVLF